MTSRFAFGFLLLLPALAAAQAAPATPAAGPSQPAAAPPAARVVTLDEAVRSALAHQPQLQQAEAGTRAAEARADQARAGLLPQAGVTGSVVRSRAASTRYSVVETEAGPTFQATSVDRTRDTWTGEVTASQRLFDPATLLDWRAAGATARATRETAQATRLDVLSNVQSAYFTARADRDLARVARETVQNDEAHLRQAQAFVEVGTQPAIALAQARAQLASARLSLIQAENGYASSRALLAQAMGLSTWEPFEVSDDTMAPVEGEDGPLEPLVEQALAARPELASLRSQAEAGRRTREAARAGWLPTLSAQASYAEAGPEPTDTAGSWSAGLTLGWSFLDGGLTSARVREAEANLDALRAQEEGLRTSIRVALEQAHLGVRAARASVEAAAEAEASAREQLRLAEGRYQAGAGSIIELGDAQVAASNAAAQRVQAEYNLSSARAALGRALGRPAP